MTTQAMAGNKLNDAMGPPEVEMIENHEGQDHETKLDSTAYEHQILSTTPKTRAEKALMLKADLCIVPLAALCYLVSYMVRLALSHSQQFLICAPQDRNNIGNARLMDWQQDISLSDSQYYNVTSLFCKRREAHLTAYLPSACTLLTLYSCRIYTVHVPRKHSRLFPPTSTHDRRCGGHVWSSSHLSFCRQKLRRRLGNSFPDGLLPVHGPELGGLHSILVPTE